MSQDEIYNNMEIFVNTISSPYLSSREEKYETENSDNKINEKHEISKSSYFMCFLCKENKPILTKKQCNSCRKIFCRECQVKDPKFFYEDKANANILCPTCNETNISKKKDKNIKNSNIKHIDLKKAKEEENSECLDLDHLTTVITPPSELNYKKKKNNNSNIFI